MRQTLLVCLKVLFVVCLSGCGNVVTDTTFGTPVTAKQDLEQFVGQWAGHDHAVEVALGKEGLTTGMLDFGNRH